MNFNIDALAFQQLIGNDYMVWAWWWQTGLILTSKCVIFKSIRVENKLACVVRCVFTNLFCCIILIKTILIYAMVVILGIAALCYLMAILLTYIEVLKCLQEY